MQPACQFVGASRVLLRKAERQQVFARNNKSRAAAGRTVRSYK
jgi:hypothetical protein